MSTDHEHAHDDAEPVTDHVHENSWSANLEGPEHADDQDRILREAFDAVDHTASGYHINLVTHANQGHPELYLFEALEEEYGDTDHEWEFIDQCGCGGYVTRVHVP